jgi:probable HAF family extracellular repeat protein
MVSRINVRRPSRRNTIPNSIVFQHGLAFVRPEDWRFIMQANRLLLLWLVLAQVATAQVYRITDLGSLGGSSNASEAFGVNLFGHVAGESCLDQECSETHPFLWTAATGLQDLGTLPNGDTFAIATGLNDSDQVVGSSAFAQPFVGTHAFLWSESRGMQDLGTLGCPDVTGANGINLFGQVVGTSTIAPCPGGGQDRAFLWTQNEGMRNLGTLPGGTFSFGNAINDLGQAVGYSDCSGCSVYHAFLWDFFGTRDLGVLSGGTFSVATGINNFGFVAGQSDASANVGLPHAALWNPFSGIRDLGTLPGGIFSSAAAVNDFGVVVGSSDSAVSASHSFTRRANGRPASTATHAFVWTAGAQMLDLNDLVIPANSGWVLIDAYGINSLGQIVGLGMFQDQTHAFLLTPTGRGHRRTTK